MQEDLFGLLALQEVDNEIDELHKHKREYPARIRQLKNQISELTEGRQGMADRLAELEASFKHFQQQLSGAKEDLKKHQERLLQITTNKEYDAVQQEIVALQHAIDEYEMEMLKADEEAAGLRQQLEEENTAQQEKVAASEAEISELQQKIDVIDADVEKVKVRREAASANLPDRLCKIYARVRRGKQLAVVRVVRGACGGCWRSLPPQRINELRMSSRIIVCEGCGRILVWDDREQ